MSTFDRARAAHAGQIDKGGASYIAHVERVAAGVHRADETIVALLHDVVEDSDWTLERLADEGFSSAVVAAVDALTRREGEDYFAFAARAIADPLSRPVKRADLLGNLDTTRLKESTPDAQARLARYRRALAMLDAATRDEAPEA